MLLRNQVLQFEDQLFLFLRHCKCEDEDHDCLVIPLGVISRSEFLFYDYAIEYDEAIAESFDSGKLYLMTDKLVEECILQLIEDLHACFFIMEYSFDRKKIGFYLIKAANFMNMIRAIKYLFNSYIA